MQQLGKYTVIRKLGVGGMAEVFLCKLVGIGGFEKHVVVKKIRSDIADDAEFVTMFFDEARLAANLSHPNIIQVFEVDQLEGMPYLAMEYVRGATLSAVLQKCRAAQRPMDVGHLAFVFAGVCAGLDHAHNARDASGRALSIVHRDISPQNIIISVDGNAKIFDFGVAKAKGSLALTGADRVKGKFAYMAPEQLRAKPVDAKADVYAAGVCMYEAVTGRRPFSGGTEAELYAARLEGRFVMPSELAPTIPVELEHLILSAMAQDPADRPTALELQEQLAGFCGAGRPHASNAQAVSAWLKDTVGELAEAYEGYSSSSPSMTPLPRSANMPPTSNAVEAASRRSRGVNATIAALAIAAVAMAILLVVILWNKHRPERVEVASAPAVQPPPVPQVVVEPPPAPLPAAAAPVTTDAPLVAAEPPAMTIERQPPAEAEPTKTPKKSPVSPKQVAPKPKPLVTTKAQASKPAVSAAPAPLQASGSGSAQVAVQVPTPAPPPIVAPPPPAPGSAAIAQPVKPAPVAARASPLPAPTSPGSLDAMPAFSKLSVDGSLTTTEVQTALGRTLDALRACYRGAAKKANQTPDVSLRVSFEIDEGARANGVRVTGDTLGLGACVKDAIGGVRTRVAPDVGTVFVSTVVRFKPTR